MKSLNIVIAVFTATAFALVDAAGGVKILRCNSSSNDNDTKTDEVFCKSSQVYPSFPYLIQPSLEVRDIIDVDEEYQSMTVYVHILTAWNDSIRVLNNTKAVGWEG